MKIEHWTEQNVSIWTSETLGFGHEIGKKFINAAIDGPLLLELTDDLLIDVGIQSDVHRLRILKEVEQIRIGLNLEVQPLQFSTKNTGIGAKPVCFFQNFETHETNFRILVLDIRCN